MQDGNKLDGLTVGFVFDVVGEPDVDDELWVVSGFEVVVAGTIVLLPWVKRVER